jgi:regulator of sigma E protease
VPGDEVVRLDGEDVGAWKDVFAIVGRLRDGEPREMVVKGADGVERTLEVRPVALVPVTGFTLELRVAREPFEADGVGRAAGLAIARTGREIADMFRMIGSLFSGNISFQKNVAGPVTIVSISSDVVEASWLRFLLFLAYISVTLAVLNILPIPVLDGGHLLFILIEKVKGSPLSEETMGKMQLVGLLLLLALMFFAFKSDFGFLTGKR